MFRNKEEEKINEVEKLVSVLDELEEENNRYVMELRQFESRVKGNTFSSFYEFQDLLPLFRSLNPS
jgi:hypothetical protein